MNRAPTLVVLVALSTACSDTARTPSAPSSAPSPTTAPTPSAPLLSPITGVVYEVTSAGRRPLPGVGIDLSVEYQSWPAKVTTDADGRYTISDAADSGLKFVAEKAGYSQPCRVHLVSTTREYDIYLVSNDTLAKAGVPASLPTVAPVLDGLVFEQTAQGRQPVAGASVVLDFSGGMGWAPSASTMTDPQGRYMLCNVVDATGFGHSALVSKPGYATTFVDVTVRTPGSFDIELKR